MIVGAAICPCSPLLVRELTGQTEVLPELRTACAAAVARVIAAGPDLIVVTGPGPRTEGWPASARLNVAAYGPGTALPGNTGLPGNGAPAGLAAPGLPLALGVGARLLDEAGYAGPRELHGVAALAPAADCLRLGARLAASAPRVALLAMGDGSARRSVSAPGYLDERAGPFDAAVERAVGDGDLAALAALDPGLADELLATGRPAWQVLAGALGPDGGAAALRPEILYADAPLGVGYLVAAFTLVPAPSGPAAGR